MSTHNIFILYHIFCSWSFETASKKAEIHPKGKGKHAAHHIIPHSEARNKDAVKAREIYWKYVGYGKIDDAVNGVWLPYEKGAGPGAYHPRLHTKKYYRELHNRLKDARNADDVRGILKQIREELENNTFPH